jgi:hypothetical protein
VGSLVLILPVDLHEASFTFFLGVGVVEVLHFPTRVFDATAPAPGDGSLADSPLGC